MSHLAEWYLHTLNRISKEEEEEVGLESSKANGFPRENEEDDGVEPRRTWGD